MHKLEEVVAAPLTKAGSGLMVASGVSHWLVANADVISVLGVIAGIFVACTGVVFQIRRDRREAALHRREAALHEKRMQDRWGKN